MHRLYEYICRELDDLERKAEKGKLTMAEMQYGDTLAHFKKNLLKAEEMSGDSYSMAGNSYNSDGYSRRSSYSRAGTMSPFSKMRGMNIRRDGYSMADNEQMLEELRGMMQDAPDEQTKMDFRRLIQRLEKM